MMFLVIFTNYLSNIQLGIFDISFKKISKYIESYIYKLCVANDGAVLTNIARDKQAVCTVSY